MNLSDMAPHLRRNRETQTVDGEHALLVGQTRFGKTYLAQRLARFYPHVVVHDPKNRFTVTPHERRLHTFDDLYSVDPENERDRVVIYAPGKEEAEDLNAQDEFCRYVFERGNCTVILDEVVRLGDRHRFPPHLRYLYTAGAGEGICVLGLTQEPVNCPSFVFTQSAGVFQFFISNRYHRDKMAGFMPIESEQIEALQKCEFYYWRNDMREVTGPHWLPCPHGLRPIECATCGLARM